MSLLLLFSTEKQEHLRAGAPAPESVVLEEDLRRQLDALGYVQYLEKGKKKKYRLPPLHALLRKEHFSELPDTDA